MYVCILHCFSHVHIFVVLTKPPASSPAVVGAPYFISSCAPVSCPSSSSGIDVPSKCTCNSGYTISIRPPALLHVCFLVNALTPTVSQVPYPSRGLWYSSPSHLLGALTHLHPVSPIFLKHLTRFPSLGYSNAVSQVI